MSSINYTALLDQVINQFFKNQEFDLKGIIQWDEVTQREKDRYFKKTGKQKTIQRVRYTLVKEIWQKPEKTTDNSPFFNYRNIYISNVEEYFFYCIIDYAWNRMGQKTRYKFKLVSMDDNKYQIEEMGQVTLMIR